jgi:hypothetical protein
MNNKLLSRRRLLRGLGGAVVAAPFLSSVAERAAKAEGEVARDPKRLIAMFTHYGCLTNRWFPKKSHGLLTREDYLGLQTLKPMAPYAHKLLMVRGLRAMNEWSFDGAYGQTTDPHTQVCGSYFTCHPVTPADGKFDAKPTARSLDHVCAEQVNPAAAAPHFMQLGGIRSNDNNTMWAISYDQPGQLFPGLASVREAYTQLTALLAPGAMSADSYKVARGQSVIDVVRDDLLSLQRVPMSSSDQKKLADWTELLHQTDRAVAAQCNAETATKLGLTSESVMAPQSQAADLPKIAALSIDIAVLNAICDANRVLLLKFPPTFTFEFLGLTLESAGLSHRIGTALMGGNCVVGVFEMLAKIDAWYAQQFAYLVERLDTFDEATGTLLDNSATVWFPEMSDGNAHNLNNLPILQAGGCGGYFKTGWAVNVEGGKTDLTVGHSEDECEGGLGGVTAPNLDSVGTPPDQGNMPINKYFCNLMNAIGVKAGPDGFPKLGGAEAVTHYGKYDDTRLFGSDEPTTISNPHSDRSSREPGARNRRAKSRGMAVA